MLPKTDRLTSMFNDKRFSDFAIKCGEQTYHVCSTILSLHSDYFYHMFEHDWKEAQERTVTLPEDEQPYIQAMLCYMYSPGMPKNETSISQAIWHANLYHVADKYQALELKANLKDQFAQHLDVNSEDFYKVVDIVYSSTPEGDRGLRDLVVQPVIKRFRQLGQNGGDVKCFGELMGILEFANDFLAAEAYWHKDIAHDKARSLKCCMCKRGFIAELIKKNNFLEDRDEVRGWCPSCGAQFYIK